MELILYIKCSRILYYCEKTEFEKQQQQEPTKKEDKSL